MKLAEKISKLKKQKKLSQSKLAAITGISRDAISKYERGDVIPSVEYARRLADALGVSLDYLTSDREEEQAIDHESLKRVRAIESLPKQEVDKIYSVVDALIRDYRS